MMPTQKFLVRSERNKIKSNYSISFLFHLGLSSLFDFNELTVLESFVLQLVANCLSAASSKNNLHNQESKRNVKMFLAIKCKQRPNWNLSSSPPRRARF